MHTSFSYQLLDAQPPRARTAKRTSADQQRDDRVARAVLCAACSARISDASQRMDVAGRHQYTFFNPAGVVYQVMCFATAPGCRGIGPFSAEFSWFPGHRWQISVCAQCGEHLGWHFEGELSFTALIEGRVVETGD